MERGSDDKIGDLDISNGDETKFLDSRIMSAKINALRRYYHSQNAVRNCLSIKVGWAWKAAHRTWSGKWSF